MQKNSSFVVNDIILKKAVNIFLLVFYSFGAFCLPMGDFTILKDIPQMYRHCRATEDKDINPVDFITEHLLNIDGIFEKHQNNDEEKPHHPFQNHNYQQTTFSFLTYFSISVMSFSPIKVEPIISDEIVLSSNYTSKILRPPIFA